MTSLEIAEFCQREHDEVLADITVGLRELGIKPEQYASTFVDSRGRSQPCFRLPARESLVFVTGYMPEILERILNRVGELEERLGPSNESSHPMTDRS